MAEKQLKQRNISVDPAVHRLLSLIAAKSETTIKDLIDPKLRELVAENSDWLAGAGEEIGQLAEVGA